MEHVSIKQLKGNKKFLENIRWDVTPRIFFEPRFSKKDDEQETTERNIDGYMLYVDLVYKKPAVVIMSNRPLLSRTVAYIDEVPDELLKEATHCTASECVSGMYPLTKKIEKWLKKALGLS
jgi:hypothetical protein